jgi:hypothetical protein
MSQSCWHRGERDGFKIASLGKEDVIAFQAGDVAAWKSRTVLENAVYAPGKTEEDAANIIRSLDPIRAIVQNNGGYDKEGLRKLCRAGRVPLRKSKSTPASGNW